MPTISGARAALLHLRWQEAERNAETLRQAIAETEQKVNELLAIVTRGTAVRTEIASELPGLRQAEAAAAVIVQKLMLTREQIETETQRVASDVEAHEQRLAQARADREREQAHRADSEAALAKLGEEDRRLSEASAAIATQLPTATETLSGMTQKVEGLDKALAELMHAVAHAEARKTVLNQEIESISTQRAELMKRREQLDVQRCALAAEVASRPDLTFASSLVAASEAELARRQQQAQSAEDNLRAAEQQCRCAR